MNERIKTHITQTTSDIKTFLEYLKTEEDQLVRESHVLVITALLESIEAGASHL